MVRSGLTTAALVALALSAAPAAAETLSPTPNPLPGGSRFQGADGDQAPTAVYTDWAPLQTAGRVTRAPDDNTQDTAFTDGLELTPDTWQLGTSAGGVTPAQSNILDVYAAVDEVGTSVFVYLAFTREKGTGTSFQTFELNRANRLWRNGAGELIPCRMTGDVLISFEPHGNDENSTVIARRWETTITDPDSGCARAGTLSAAVQLGGAIQGAANSDDIPNSLPGLVGTPIPERQFGEVAVNLGALFDGISDRPCGAFTSFWMHSRSSDSVTSDMKDFVAPQEIDARRCSARGTKWLDLNADGIRQGGDVGLQGWRIYADLNDNGRYDGGEPYAISDANGDYIIDDIRATGTYVLREEPTSGVSLSGPWTCSHPSPCAWEVNAALEPNARDRDFGNWRPARITVVKKVDPPGDPGEFDLIVGENVLRNAGHGDNETFAVKPGTYAVFETASEGTDGSLYTSSVMCTGPLKRTARRLRAASTSVSVIAGERVECTFVNTRIAVPSITIDKIPPPPTLTGQPLVYLFRVNNTGNVAFPEADVEVRDRDCDAAPQLVERLDGAGAQDATPGSLDPGDEWTYRCEVATQLPPDPDDCEPETVSNRATVTAPGASDADRALASLFCPPQRRREVQLVKLAPITAVAGNPLTYRMYLSNTGEVAFPESAISVTDPNCDAPPVIVARYAERGLLDDSTPAVLDPDDVWIYECTRTTVAPPPAECQPFSLDNTATVVVTPPNRPDIGDSDSATTPLTCPPLPPDPPIPPEPPAPPPAPEPPPEPVGPSGDAPVVPEAGTAGAAALSPLRRCLRRGSRVTIRGSRIASVRVFVNGRRVGGLQVRALQRRAVIRLNRNFVPGRYRATALVRFARGSDTPSLRLTRVVRVCARRQVAPRFTG